MFAMFFVNGLVLLDPDFGWHIELGRRILSDGIPNSDPFSYTMESFPFIDHEWLTNVGIYKIYLLIGRVGLAFIFTVLVFFVVLIVSKTTILLLDRKKVLFPKIIFIPLILFLAGVFPFFGVRPQVESWVFLSIFNLVLFNDKLWQRFSWWLPLLVIVWTNLHGSFAISVVALTIFLVVRILREKIIRTQPILVLVACVIATFLNPYGIKIWLEVWQQISDFNLRWQVQEWKPAIFTFNLGFWGSVMLSLYLITKFRLKFNLEFLAINLFFLFQAISSTRHVPLWLIVNLPMLVVSLSYLKDDFSKIKHGKERSLEIYKLGLFGSIFIFVFQSGLCILTTTIALSEDNYYPSKAVNYLKYQPATGEIFSQYGWGGYLIWKIPGRKVFIDGRMPSWRWKDAPVGESDNAMKDYVGIVQGDVDYVEVFEEHNVDTVLWSNEGQKDPISFFEDKYFNQLDPLYRFMGKKHSKYNFTEKLKENGWKIVYSDSIAVVYQRP